MGELEERFENRVELGKRIKKFREDLDLKQNEFAKLLGIGNSYLSSIENGLKSPKFDFFHKLALQFDVSLDYLLFGVEPMRIKDKIETFKDNRDYIGEILTREDLLWYIDHSTLFRDTIMSYASKFHLDNEMIIRKNIKSIRKKTQIGGKTK